MKALHRYGYALYSCLFILALLMLTSISSANQQQDAMSNALNDAKLVAVKGPANIPLLDQASLDLPSGYIYIPAKEGAEIMQAIGNHMSSNFYGLVLPDSSSNWFIAINYIKSGYIEDTEAKNWKADELLSQLKKGTNDVNEERKKNGFPTLDISGWITPPTYDATKHKLIWAIDGSDSDGHDVVNYNTFALGREGYFTLNLITDKANVNADKEDANKILTAINYNAGKRYEDYIAGKDHLAEFSLAALVTGVVAHKLGLLALAGVFFVKIWKGLIIFVLIFWKKIKKVLGFQK